MENQFPLTTIINVSVSVPPPGFAGFNTGNLCIFSDEPYGEDFPDTGIQYYQNTNQVALDFGTGSRTYAEAVAIFSQNQNILLAGGQLIIVAMKTATMTLTYDGVPASGTWVANWGGNASVAINWDDTALEVQGKIQAIPGLENVLVSGTQAGELLTLALWGVYGKTPAVITITDNSLATSVPADITITAAISVDGESIVDCLTRTQSLTAYAAVIVNELYEAIGSTDYNAAAAAFQATNIMLGMVGVESSENTADSGVFWISAQAGNDQTRNLTYLDDTPNNALKFLAGYFSRLMSVDYTGNNTTLTMNLKQLISVPVDSVIAPGTDYNAAKAAGSDVYISIEGKAGVISFGENEFADQVTNRLWLKGAIQTAYFNVLAQTATKIPQTEDGMNAVKNALKQVLNQAVSNAYLAPGTWTSPDTFGNLTDFYANIEQYGYYVYSAPIGKQSQTDRGNRVAPIIQIAVKEAGAIQSGNVFILINP